MILTYVFLVFYLDTFINMVKYLQRVPMDVSINWHYHYVKIVQIRRYFWSVFFCMRTEYTKIWARNNSVIGHFSRIVSASRFRKDLFRNIQDEIILEVLKATICLHMKKKSKIVCSKREEYLTTN